MQKIERKSGIELIKIIATFLIVIHHVVEAIPVDFNNKIGDILIFVFSGKMGNLGNCIFIVASAYFLVDSKKTKPEKAVYLMLFETLSAFVLILIRVCFGRTISFADIKNAISPFLTDTYWWFINAYILYYLIHGYINKCLKNLTKEEHFLLVFFSLLFYTIMPVLIHNQIPTSGLTSFVVIHIFISYVKKSNLQKALFNKFTAILFGTLYFTLILLSYELDVVTGTHYFSWRSNVSTTTFYNIILLIFTTSLIFNVQQNVKFHSNLVNEISPLSLLMFIIHHSPQSINLVRRIGWKFCDGFISYDLDRILYIAIAIGYYIFCIILSVMYKRLFNSVIINLSNVFTNKIKKICKLVYEKIENE